MSFLSVPVQDYITYSQLAVPQLMCNHLSFKTFVKLFLSLRW